MYPFLGPIFTRASTVGVRKSSTSNRFKHMSRFSHPWSRFFFGNHGFLGYKNFQTKPEKFPPDPPSVHLHDIHQKCGFFPKKPSDLDYFTSGYFPMLWLQSATIGYQVIMDVPQKSTPSDKRGPGAMAPADSEGEVVMAPSNTSWEDSAGVNSMFAFWGGGMAEKVLLKISRGLRMGYKFFLNIASTCARSFDVLKHRLVLVGHLANIYLLTLPFHGPPW